MTTTDLFTRAERRAIYRLGKENYMLGRSTTMCGCIYLAVELYEGILETAVIEMSNILNYFPELAAKMPAGKIPTVKW